MPSGLRNRTLIFALLIGWCAALFLVRVLYAHSLSYSFLVWNLFLATIPAIAAVLYAKADSRLGRIWWFFMWLLFLPNAPYIVTDFVHLRQRTGAPLWFDVALLLSFAGTGLLLGYSSLEDVQVVISKRYGMTAGWILAFTALLLSGFGIYLGRFARWNSWNAVTDPIDVAGYLLSGASNPFSHPKTIAVTIIYGVGLVLGYLAYQLPRSLREVAN